MQYVGQQINGGFTKEIVPESSVANANVNQVALSPCKYGLLKRPSFSSSLWNGASFSLSCLQWIAILWYCVQFDTFELALDSCSDYNANLLKSYFKIPLDAVQMNCILQLNSASIEDIVKLYKQFCSSKIGSQIILHYKKLLYGKQVKIVPIISDMNSMIRLQADGQSR